MSDVNLLIKSGLKTKPLDNAVDTALLFNLKLQDQLLQKSDIVSYNAHLVNVSNPHAVTKSQILSGNLIENADVSVTAAIAYSKLNIANDDLTIAKTSGLQTALDSKVDESREGNANGIATLDAGGKIPVSQLPSSLMEYKGTWNASTNTPALANGTGDNGDVWKTSVAGTVNFGAGNIVFAAGDWAIYNGTVWEKSVNSDAVDSVNGLTGAVVLDTDDVLEGTNKYYASSLFDTDFSSKDTDDLSEGASNLYFTSARAKASTVSDDAYGVGWDGVTDVSPSKNAVYDQLQSMGGALVSDDAYGAGWDGVTGIAPSKNAVYDKIEALTTDAIDEGSSNLYFTTARARAVFEMTGANGEGSSGFVLGNIVYMDGANNFKLASKDADLPMQILKNLYMSGASIAAGASGTLYKSGARIALTGTKGATIYLNTAGGTTGTQPTTGDVVVVGQFVETNTFEFKPSYLISL
jgi:hypothetical protein